MSARPLALGGWLAGLAVAAAVLGTSTRPLLDGLADAGAGPDRAVAAGAAAAAWLVMAWLGMGLALTVAEVVLDALTNAGGGCVGPLATWVTPSGLRRAVRSSLRVGLVAGAVGSTLVVPSQVWAAPSPPTADRSADRAAPTSWPVLDRPALPVRIARPTTTAANPEPATAAPMAHYRVRAGDSLWSIAAHHLPAGASAADVARAWPRWWRANLDVVGADPGLIRPGQLLRAPDTAS